MFAANKTLRLSAFRLIGSIAMLLLVAGSNMAGAANQIPTPGFDSKGNWVDTSLVTWEKITKGEFTYSDAKTHCKTKDASTDINQWQLPTSKQAESFYKHAVRPNLLNNLGWELGTIWTSTGGAGHNHQIVNLKFGTISWAGVPDVDNGGKYVACVALPQGFDSSGNYFDGNVMWSKITKETVTHKGAAEFCAKKEPAGTWKLPSYEQLYGLADALIFRTVLREAMTNQGWTLGMTFSHGNSIALGDVANTPTKDFVTCVHS